MRAKFVLFDPWVWKMAWRDSRSHRRRMVLFSSCILVGVAALVAIRSLGDNLKDAVDEQAKTLLGADLVIRSQRAFGAETEALIDSIGGDQSREVRFASMVYFPGNGGTRLVQVRAVAGGFPFYGKLVTEPAEAAEQYHAEGKALLDDALLLQYDVGVGDSVRVGALSFQIGGRLKRIPGEATAVMTVAPRVFIPMPVLERTGLIQPGSLATYAVYFRFKDGDELRSVVRAIRPRLRAEGLRHETVQSRKRRLERTLGNLYRFLSLVGFAALLLGCVGVASAIHVYVRQKLSTVAVLRCLGAQDRQAFAIYLVQAFAMGLGGSTAGALAGLLIQRLLPSVLGEFLPVDLSVTVSWTAVLEGVLVGLGLTLMFALLPLLSVRRVSPLRALRVSYEAARERVDPLRVGVVLLIVLLVGGLAVAQTGRWWMGLGVTVGFLVAFGLLAGVALLLMRLVKRYFPTSWRYVWRQGLANLYRPNNQTPILMLSLGLGTFLIATLYLSQHSLLKQISLSGGGQRPNLVLFDVQTDQVEGVVELIRSFDLPILHRVPVVTMRLASVKGESVEALRKSRKISRWALSREYRSTYRERLFDTEKILSGTWTESATEGPAPVPVSMEQGIAQRLGVGLGDTLTFDVQGVPVAATVGSIREVDWQRVQPNFFVVFPKGVLEPAPQFYVFTTRVGSTAQSAAFQRRLVQAFANVSVVDLGLILQTVDDILSQVTFVIRFMALFSILTGVLVLASAVLTSRYQRVQEGVLLRTLGASRRQIVQILFLEYLFLGGLAALTGLILAVGGSWALARFVFEVAFAVPGPAIGAVFVLVTGLTVGVGMLNSRGIARRTPLEVLRAEG